MCFKEYLCLQDKNHVVMLPILQNNHDIQNLPPFWITTANQKTSKVPTSKHYDRLQLWQYHYFPPVWLFPQINRLQVFTKIQSWWSFRRDSPILDHYAKSTWGELHQGKCVKSGHMLLKYTKQMHFMFMFFTALNHLFHFHNHDNSRIFCDIRQLNYQLTVGIQKKRRVVS
jgi:hypothetical protein